MENITTVTDEVLSFDNNANMPRYFTFTVVNQNKSFVKNELMVEAFTDSGRTQLAWKIPNWTKASASNKEYPSDLVYLNLWASALNTNPRTVFRNYYKESNTKDTMNTYPYKFNNRTWSEWNVPASTTIEYSPSGQIATWYSDTSISQCVTGIEFTTGEYDFELYANVSVEPLMTMDGKLYTATMSINNGFELSGL